MMAGAGRSSTRRSAAALIAVAAAVLVPASGLVAAPGAVAASGGFVEAGKTIEEMRVAEEKPAAARVDATAADHEVLVKSLGWGALFATTGTVLLLLWRRRRTPAARLRTSAGRLEVIDRVPLSPKHWACALRLDDKKIVVGVCADRVVPLAVFEPDRPLDSHAPAPAPRPVPVDDQLVETAPPVDSRAAGSDASVSAPSLAVSPVVEPPAAEGSSEKTYWFRPAPQVGPPASPAAAAPASEPGSWDGEFAPYRREVTRLRSVLQSWQRETRDVDGRGTD